MPLPILCKELQEKAEEELNEVPSKIQENVAHIRKWLGRHSHLKTRRGTYHYILFILHCLLNLFIFILYIYC